MTRKQYDPFSVRAWFDSWDAGKATCRKWHKSMKKDLLKQGLTEAECASVLAGLHIEEGADIMDADMRE